MNTETDHPSAVVAPARATTVRDKTPPQLRAAIEEIQGFVYAPSSMTEGALAPTLVGTTLQVGDSALPVLETRPWPYSSTQEPNPISIIKAREMLVNGYGKIPLKDMDLHG